jgi:hypothetical protein
MRFGAPAATWARPLAVPAIDPGLLRCRTPTQPVGIVPPRTKHVKKVVLAVAAAVALVSGVANAANITGTYSAIGEKQCVPGAVGSFNAVQEITGGAAASLLLASPVSSISTATVRARHHLPGPLRPEPSTIVCW